MTLSHVKASCGLGVLWALGTWAEGLARACPTAHQEQGSQGDTRRPLRASPELWVEFMAGHSRAVRRWRPGSLGHRQRAPGGWNGIMGCRWLGGSPRKGWSGYEVPLLPQGPQHLILKEELQGN